MSVSILRFFFHKKQHSSRKRTSANTTNATSKVMVNYCQPQKENIQRVSLGSSFLTFIYLSISCKCRHFCGQTTRHVFRPHTAVRFKTRWSTAKIDTFQSFWIFRCLLLYIQSQTHGHEFRATRNSKLILTVASACLWTAYLPANEERHLFKYFAACLHVGVAACRLMLGQILTDDHGTGMRWM